MTMLINSSVPLMVGAFRTHISAMTPPIVQRMLTKRTVVRICTLIGASSSNTIQILNTSALMLYPEFNIVVGRLIGLSCKLLFFLPFFVDSNEVLQAVTVPACCAPAV